MGVNKKKNSSGFTLVELIVVMCIMGIIMGAVLNFIQPTARLYKTTNNYLNEEEAVTMISDYLQDDLLYATGVYVYVADPANPDDADINKVYGKINSTLAQPIKPSNCIVLNNTSIRSDYNAAATRGATGSIQKYALNGTRYYDVTLNDALLANNKVFTNNFALRDQTFMGDEKYFFTVNCDYSDAADDKYHALRVTTDVYKPVYDDVTQTYKFKEVTYSATKAVEFINLSAGRVTFDSHFVASQSDSPYIYIFYDRKDKITNGAGGATKVNYKCYILDKDSDPITYFADPALEGTAPVGSDISQVIQEKCDSQIELSFEKDGIVYKRTGEYAYDKIDMAYDPNKLYADLSNITNPTGGTELALYAVYETVKLEDMPKSVVKFYDLNDSTGSGTPILQVPDVEYGSDITGKVPAWVDDTDDSTAGVHTYNVWCDLNTNNEHGSFSKITTDVSVYKKVITKYYVTFEDADGNQISWVTDPATGATTDHLEVTSGEGIPANQMLNEQDYAKPDDGPGKYSWVFKNGVNVGETVAPDLVITGPTVVQLSFVPTPAKAYSVSCTAGEVNSGWNNNITISPITITNKGAEDYVDDITIKIKFDCNVVGITSKAYNWDGFVQYESDNSLNTTFSGDTVTIVVKFKPDSSDKFSPGRSFTVNGLVVSLSSATGKYVDIE